jgi:hypothetical protein
MQLPCPGSPLKNKVIVYELSSRARVALLPLPSSFTSSSHTGFSAEPV